MFLSLLVLHFIYFLYVSINVLNSKYTKNVLQTIKVLEKLCKYSSFYFFLWSFLALIFFTPNFFEVESSIFFWFLCVLKLKKFQNYEVHPKSPPTQVVFMIYIVFILILNALRTATSKSSCNFYTIIMLFQYCT